MYYDERPDRGKSAKPSVALYDSHVFLFLYNAGNLFRPDSACSPFLRVCLFPGCDRSLAVLAVWMECGKRPVIMV